jgi:DNA gyrase subunit B
MLDHRHESRVLTPRACRALVEAAIEGAGAATGPLSTLVGDKVEPRREFIEKHALDVRNLDV